MTQSIQINGTSVPNLPWEERPATHSDPVWRYSRNPVIGWNPIPCGARVFNSAAIPHEGAFIGALRVDYKNGRPQLHLARSRDGIQWEIEHEMIQWVTPEGEPIQNSYAYDPRLVKIEDTYYFTWCDDFKGASIGLGYTKDFKTFVKSPNPLMPFNRNGVLFPRKIKGEFVMLSRPSDSGHTPFGDIFLSHSPDAVYWGKHHHVMSPGGLGWWQGQKIGSGPVPIETSEGWLLFYHGVSNTCNGFVYSMGAAILDLDQPWKVKYRTRDYLLTPEQSYETTGFVPNVVFPCANICDADTGRIAIYYGAADTHTAIAFTKIQDLIPYIQENSEV